MNQCLDLSMITVPSIRVCDSRKSSFKSKFSRKFCEKTQQDIKYISSQELCPCFWVSLELNCSGGLVCLSNAGAGLKL